MIADLKTEIRKLKRENKKVAELEPLEERVPRILRWAKHLSATQC